MLDLWNQLTSSSKDIIDRKAHRDATVGPSNAGAAGSGGGPAGKKVLDPVDDFVNMEYDLAGELCAEVNSSLKALEKVLLGSGLLTPAIQAAATSLLSGAVPPDWSRLWEGPEKPQGWLRELVRKRLALRKWKDALGKNSLLNSPLALGDLFNPRTFINALRQQTARQLGTAIDLVKMVCSWEKDNRRLKADCPLPCVLSNLLLQGAAFAGSLRESAPEASEMTPTPEVTIGFVPLGSKDVYEADMAVTVPVYLSPSREDHLTELQMPIAERNDYDKWILSGVALFLNEED